VYQQVSQESIPLGPLATLMPLLQMAGMLNDNNIKNALKVGSARQSPWYAGEHAEIFYSCLPVWAVQP
jgi:hypothetical protein